MRKIFNKNKATYKLDSNMKSWTGLATPYSRFTFVKLRSSLCENEYNDGDSILLK